MSDGRPATDQVQPTTCCLCPDVRVPRTLCSANWLDWPWLARVGGLVPQPVGDSQRMHLGGGGDGATGGRVRGGVIRGGAGGEPAQEAGNWNDADVVRASEPPTRISIQQAANRRVSLVGLVETNWAGGNPRPPPAHCPVSRSPVSTQGVNKGFGTLTYMDMLLQIPPLLPLQHIRGAIPKQARARRPFPVGNSVDG